MTRQRAGLQLVPAPVRRTQSEQGLREGSTGRIVYVAPQQVRLQRVWAVEDTAAAAEDRQPEPVAATDGEPAAVEAPRPGMAFYRKYTEALLRRYLRLAMQAGRVPSLMNRDVFRGQVTHYRVRGFEELVIFCHDVEQRIARLNATDQQLIKRIAMQRYSRGEAAAMLGMSLNTCLHRYGVAVDRLTELLLEAGLLDLSKR